MVSALHGRYNVHITPFEHGYIVLIEAYFYRSQTLENVSHFCILVNRFDIISGMQGYSQPYGVQDNSGFVQPPAYTHTAMPAGHHPS